MEALLRAGVPVGLYRVDLGLARCGNAAVVSRQRQGFLDFLDSFERERRRAAGGHRLPGHRPAWTPGYRARSR